MKYGVSYYPEQKKKEEIKRDIELMVESGINIVRMGEFAWCRFEPKEGIFCFDWLDDVVEELGMAGIDSIICTPTACPPAWLVEKHPDILYVDNRNVTRPFGGRRDCCYNNPVYREYSRIIAEETGKHYGSNPYVYAFQVDNELAQEGTGRCHCKCCRDKFTAWLKQKYGTIENLNEKMGTIFWGQEYDHFGQINMPINTIEYGTKEEILHYFENPSLRLEYERFCSESIIEYQNIQYEALKKHTDKIVTTNGTGLATNSINYYKAFEKLDNYAFDFYPSLRHGQISSFPYAFARGVKNMNFWLLEFVSGGGHSLRGTGRLQPYPGAMRQAVLHAFCSGADLVAHFQFKTFPYGAEQLNYSIVNIDGIKRRLFYEMKDTAADVRKMEDMLKNSVIKNSVAICFDYDTLWALKIKPVNDREGFDYLLFCGRFYDTLAGMGVGADVISFNHSLDGYAMVILPAPVIMDEEHKERLKAYVKNGGVLVSTFLTGIKDRYNTGIPDSLPCGLTDLFGIRVGEVEPVFPDTMEKVALTLGNEKIYGTNLYWTEVLEPFGAEMIGVYSESFRVGRGVISSNRFGAGKAFYLGTALDDHSFKKLLGYLLKESNIEKAPVRFEPGVEVIQRQYNGDTFYCIFNFLKRETRVVLDGTYIDCLNGGVFEGEIPAKGFVCCRRKMA